MPARNAPVGPRKPCEGRHGVDDPGRLAGAEFPRFVGHQKGLCFFAFHGHKRIGGLATASQIAAASALSGFARLP